MTIASATNKSGPYFYNGSATSFEYQFKISNAAHIRVVETVIATGVETDLVLNTDYTVTGVGADTGNVLITPARAAGKMATLVRKNPFTQGVVLENQGAYFAKVVEGAFDDAVARDQQLQEQISRAVVVPVSADATDLETLIGGVIQLLDNVDAVVTVAGISTAVTAVAANAAPTAIVAGNIDAVVIAASNMATIIAVPALATQVAADRVQTGQDRTAVATNKGLVDTAKTAVDVAKAAADADVVLTHADVVLTHADAVATAADRVQTGIDKAAAAASAASVVAADIVHYTAETNTTARQAQARKNIGIEFGYPLLHVVDEKAATTAGGGSTATTWHTRVLNTVRNNEISAGVASNQITLLAGTYIIYCSAPGYRSTAHKLRLRNITDGTTILVGTSEYSSITSDNQTRSFLSGRFTLAATKIIELQHFITTAQATNGLGTPVAGSSEVEVYADVRIERLK